MRAVILVGGEGTRLRPLTSELPKPAVKLVDRPLMAFMLEWLAANGIVEVIMACGFKPDAMRDALGDGGKFGLQISYVAESEPLGTGGALRFADEHSPSGLGERFVMCNGDVLTDLDLAAQITHHREFGAQATLSVVPVADPSSFGLVRVGDDGEVLGFLEKPEPEEIDTDLISAGAYVLERSVLDLIEPGRAVSIEHEVWPRLVGNGLNAVADRDAYWLDIGTPSRYLEATADILSGAVKTKAGARLDDRGLAIGEGCRIEGELIGPSVLGDNCTVAAGATVGPGAALGDDVEVAAGASIEAAAVLDRCSIGAGAIVRNAILSPDVKVGDEARISELAVVGSGVSVAAGSVLDDGAKVFASGHGP
jgi:mannose-1-phosphate guanylyltransferase